MRIGIIVFFFFLGATAWSQENTVEKLYLELTQQTGAQAFQSIQKKLLQLVESYSYETSGDGRVIHFVTDQTDRCPKGNKPGPIYTLTSQVYETSESSRTQARHEGCGNAYLKEDIYIEGPKPVAPSVFSLLTGVRQFTAPEGQRVLQFEARNQADDVFFRFYEENQYRDRRFYLWVKDSLLVQAHWNKVDNTLTVKSLPILVEWRLLGGRWRIEYDVPEQSHWVREGLGSSPEIWSVDSQRLVSVNDYKTSIIDFVFRPITYALQNQFQHLDMVALPKSAFSANGANSDRLKDEVRAMIERLQAGDSQSVIAELLRLLESIENGLIRDLR